MKTNSTGETFGLNLRKGASSSLLRASSHRRSRTAAMASLNAALGRSSGDVSHFSSLAAEGMRCAAGSPAQQYTSCAVLRNARPRVSSNAIWSTSPPSIVRCVFSRCVM